MINHLKSLWSQASTSPKTSSKHDTSLAVAALMTEVMRMDGRLDNSEKQHIMLKLKQRFALNNADIETLMQQAQQQTEQAVDLHQFTSVAVKSFSTDERIHILAELWQVAMADGHIDPYEEQLIRRIADLLGLHHSQFIQAKITAGATEA